MKIVFPQNSAARFGMGLQGDALYYCRRCWGYRVASGAVDQMGWWGLYGIANLRRSG